MKTFISLSAIALTIGVSHAETFAGARPISFEAPHHGKQVAGMIYYPSDSQGTEQVIGENAVFFGKTVRAEGDIAPGEYPVVLLSHGLGGNWRSLVWLATALAKDGVIAITVDHPHSTTFDFDMRKGLDHWTRAQDLSLALDLVYETFPGQIDDSKVMAAGFSYGGWTALSLGGLTGKLEAMVEHCEDVRDRSTHCADLERAGVNFNELNPEDWDASVKDARINMVAAIDPALHFGLDASNLDELIENVQLISLGQGDDRLLATDYDASGFGEIRPFASTNIAPAYHFSMLPLCKPAGPAILKEENDDPVCTDPLGADREEIHSEVIELISNQLGL